MAYLHVKATVEDYDAWKSSFDGYQTLRAEHGGKGHQVFQSADNPNEIVVVIEFDSVEKAREWTDYLKRQGELTGPNMPDAELSYLELVEQKQLSAV
ncbi:antibiotic biosynthesis monooxygenase [Haloferax sp. DFSO52]|uniref:antibiotic biosynthesis monooxygenase n=1 Tax=Haloferax sp. DFSO52 TaxID=3388505 RepID=UPI003A8897FC